MIDLNSKEEYEVLAVIETVIEVYKINDLLEAHYQGDSNTILNGAFIVLLGILRESFELSNSLAEAEKITNAELLELFLEEIDFNYFNQLNTRKKI